jgi:hypothetical protein
LLFREDAFAYPPSCHSSRPIPTLSTFARLLPILTIVIAAFALYQLFTAIMLAARGQWPFAALYAVMSIAGWALARTLWINKRKLSAPPE